MYTNYKLFKEDMGVRMMAFEIPAEETWERFRNTEVPCGITYMDKTYLIREKDVQLFKDNVGKTVQFKYNQDEKMPIIEFPKISDF